MEILSKRERVWVDSFMHHFSFVNDPYSGYAFSCDAEGNLLEELSERYAQCLAGECDGNKVIDDGIADYSYSYMEPARGRCICGEIVALEGFTNTCDNCERDYNLNGSLLASRSQWGEETGETVDDILSVDRRY